MIIYKYPRESAMKCTKTFHFFYYFVLFLKSQFKYLNFFFRQLLTLVKRTIFQSFEKFTNSFKITLFSQISSFSQKKNSFSSSFFIHNFCQFRRSCTKAAENKCRKSDKNNPNMIIQFYVKKINAESSFPSFLLRFFFFLAQKQNKMIIFFWV